jgi:hypothetical protein
MRIKALERGTTGATIKLNSEGAKKIEKYNPNKFQKSQNFNTDSEVQISKKKHAREEDDDEEEIPVKKTVKKQKVEEDSD